MESSTKSPSIKATVESPEPLILQVMSHEGTHLDRVHIDQAHGKPHIQGRHVYLGTEKGLVTRYSLVYSFTIHDALRLFMHLFPDIRYLYF